MTVNSWQQEQGIDASGLTPKETRNLAAPVLVSIGPKENLQSQVHPLSVSVVIALKKHGLRYRWLRGLYSDY
jgi:hypothetical protein